MIGIVLALAAVFVLFEGDIPAAEVDAKYINSASQFLLTEDGARIHYRDQGNQDGLPLVLVHGAMASLHTWEPWVEILGDDYRLITLDLPAHGLTGAVPAGSYGGDAFTMAIDAVADAAGLDEFILGGNSMGGGATWGYALAHPERVRAMILVDSVAPAESEGAFEQPEANGPVAFSLLRQDWFRAIARYLDPAPLIKQGLLSAYNNSPVVTPALVDRYYQLIMREGTRAAILGRVDSMGETAPTPADLGVLTQPTLILWGEQDAVIPVSTATRLEAILPNTTTVIYPQLGHIPMEEAPELTASDVRQFLDSLEGSH